MEKTIGKMSSAKVYINNNQNKIKIPTGTKMLIRRCCNAVLSQQNFDKKSEVSVSFIDDADMKRLNSTYRNINNTTDVLSFPMCTDGQYDLNHETGNVILGDIVISLERTIEQAKAFSRTFTYELAFLTVHSMLHLLGYDHENDAEEADKMRKQETLIMESMSLTINSGFLGEA